MQAFAVTAIQDHISGMDAHIDAFEERVQKRLAEAWPSNFSAM